jgi:hypothetical protein
VIRAWGDGEDQGRREEEGEVSLREWLDFPSSICTQKFSYGSDFS